MNFNKSILFVGFFLIVSQSMAMDMTMYEDVHQENMRRRHLGNSLVNPLMSLLSAGKIEELKKQVENGANVNEYNERSVGIDLLWAIVDRLSIIDEATVIELVNLFIKKGADVHRTTGESCHTILHKVSIDTILPLIDSVIAAGVDVNVKSKCGKTPLYSALWEWSLRQSIDNKHLLIVEKLIVAGADVNAKCNYKDTPLHNAVYDKNMVALLLFHNADYTSKDRYGNKPYDCTDNIEIKKMLESSESVRNVIMPQVHEKVFHGNNPVLALRNREYGIRRILPKITS